MREVGRPSRSDSFTAHEWEPRFGPPLGSWPSVMLLSDGPVRNDTTGGSVGDRRLVGIDLGVASAHSVRVLDGSGSTVAKRKALPTVASLSVIEAAALEGAAPGT